MKEKAFFTDKALGFGWQVTKKNFWFFVGVLLIIFFISYLPEIAEFLGLSRFLLSFVFLLSFILSIIASMGLVKICLNFYDKKNNDFSVLFSQYKLFVSYFFAMLLYAVMVILGLLLFIAPGIYLAVKFIFFEYFIIDKGCGTIESLRRSWYLSQGSFWSLLGFSIITIVINILGLLFFGVGLFVSIPITYLAWTFVYRSLLGSEKKQKVES